MSEYTYPSNMDWEWFHEHDEFNCPACGKEISYWWPNDQGYISDLWSRQVSCHYCLEIFQIDGDMEIIGRKYKKEASP